MEIILFIAFALVGAHVLVTIRTWREVREVRGQVNGRLDDAHKFHVKLALDLENLRDLHGGLNLEVGRLLDGITADRESMRAFDRKTNKALNKIKKRVEVQGIELDKLAADLSTVEAQVASLAATATPSPRRESVDDVPYPSTSTTGPNPLEPDWSDRVVTDPYLPDFTPPKMVEEAFAEPVLRHLAPPT